MEKVHKFAVDVVIDLDLGGFLREQHRSAAPENLNEGVMIGKVVNDFGG